MTAAETAEHEQLQRLGDLKRREMRWKREQTERWAAERGIACVWGIPQPA